LAAAAASLTPKAYDTLLDTVLSVTRERAGPRGYTQILKAAAAKIAGRAPVGAEFSARLADTQALLTTIGAEVDVQRRGGKLRLVGTDCPLASVVGTHPELCSVLADVIARRLGVPVKQCCDRSAPLPRCCFEARAPTA
jgi:predicted ArsR family transcriptional regulator